MRDYQGLELEQICNILGLSASNIRVLVHRARLQVYAMVERLPIITITIIILFDDDKANVKIIKSISKDYTDLRIKTHLAKK